MKPISKRITIQLSVLVLVSIMISKSYAQNDPPQIIKNPSFTMYSAESRKYNGVPSIAISPNGRLWATWFASVTPGEDKNSYVVVATSGDKGENWEEVLAIDPDGPGPHRAFNPEIWLDPTGKLWLFWVQSRQNWQIWALTTYEVDSANPVWSEPRSITEGNMMCKPTVLSTGEWILPASNRVGFGFPSKKDLPYLQTKDGARAVVSTDQGQNWHVRGAVYVPPDVWHWDEHMIVERKDGTLWMLVRTTYGIGESISRDRGVTWSPLKPSKIENPTARFFIRRLSSGNILLVKNGPIDMRVRRQHMMAFISKDDGHSWSNGLLLDERLGVSYPDGQQVEDGNIYIIYDYDRMGKQEILMTRFKEEDIIQCSDRKMVETWQRRRIVSKGGLE
jgi:predicted neuraminidase